MRALIILTTLALAFVACHAFAYGFAECQIIGSSQTIVVQGDRCPPGTYFIRFL